MSRRSKKGALLGLVVFCALILVVLGFGLLYLIMQLGGGQELQHATDAGNLNVAKQVLRHPGVVLQSGDEANHFGDSDDPDTGEVNLLTVNKLVAQTFLVSANAQALGTPNALGHAADLMNVLEGVSNRLNTQLINSSNFDSHFGNVAQNHAMRMFEAGTNPVLHMGTEHAVSLMVRGEPTNVFLDSSQILSGAPTLNNSNSVKVTPNPTDNRRFLRGYTQLAANGPESLWGVPLRPGQPPHLVSQRNFNQDQNRGPIPAFVPPNAYRSAGRATDKTASSQDTRALSMSLVGSLATQFPGDIRRGVIVVDNAGYLNGNDFLGNQPDIWQDHLMNPNYIEVLGGNANTGLVSDQNGGSPNLSTIKAFVGSNYTALSSGDATAQSQLASLIAGAGIDSFGNYPSNPTQLSQDMNFIDFVNGASVTHCDNTTTGSGRQPCNLEKFVGLYGGAPPNGPPGQPLRLMAVEKYHLDICNTRASGAECADVSVVATDTGLKKYDRNDCGLTQIREGRLGELISQTSSTAIIPQMITYMHQMKPSASGNYSTGEIGSVFSSTVAFDKVSYIYLNPTTNTLVLTTQAPPWPLPNLALPGVNLPDGADQDYNSGVFSLDNITNCSGECGYPHPWDCPLESQGTGQDLAKWTPSSGFRNILGVLKLRNRAGGGGHFCCPC